MRTLYSAAIEAVVWLLLVPVELVRIVLGRSSRQVLAERLGSIGSGDRRELERLRGGPSSRKRRLLIHAVSAGEMSAASALVHELDWRGWRFVISAGNDDAHRTALRIRERHPSVESIVRWPWDRRRAIDRWLGEIEPDAMAVIETEIWPNLFLVCRDRGIPLIVAGARIDPAPARRYRLFRRFFVPILATTAAILAVDDEERERYLAIGVAPERVSVAGSLKAEACWILHQSPLRSPRRGMRIVCASTHAGEEKLIANSMRQLADGHGAVDLVLVPRHPRRAPSVRRQVRLLWPHGRVEVIDRMGALSEIYATCDLVIIGGTFAAIGGHDVFEPARAGCAMVAGPNFEHIRGIVDAMRAAGAIRITTARELPSTIAELLRDDGERRRLAECARAFAAARTGASATCANRIEELAAGSPAGRR